MRTTPESPLATPAFSGSYTPIFADSEQTPAQRWHLVGGALASGGNRATLPTPGLTILHLRYIAGEIDLVQLLDESKRRWPHPEAPAADVRPLPPEQPGRAYPYAAEMAQLLVELAEIPYQPYLNVTDELPTLT